MANSNGNFIKRKRSANWDALEKSLLKSCMKEFVSIIENKNTDTNTNKSKTIAWQKVMKRFVKYHVYEFCFTFLVCKL
ncbi:unnamed protein product [Parnassius mnemosyne]|uniref:Regulatory protein zeste n=1 Tax=Parnassius mnemosyne TaxID=213953 RepID=A0AAV1KQA3_9NEOP